MRRFAEDAGTVVCLGLAVAIPVCIAGGQGEATPAAAAAVSKPDIGQAGGAAAVTPAGLNVYSVAMHLHGHSNHNAVVWNGQVASMQWHSAQASVTDAASVLWWSDHVGMFDQSRSFSVDLMRRTEVEVLGNLDVIGLTWNPGVVAYAARLEASYQGGSPSAEMQSNGLSVQLASDPGDEWQSFTYEPKSGSKSGLIHNQQFARPLSSGAILDLGLDCNSRGPDAFCEVELRLAWHYDESPVQQTLRYWIDSEIEEKLVSITSPEEVLVRVPVRGDGRYSLDLLADAGDFRFGDDNTINRITFGVLARQGATAAMKLRGFRLRSTRTAKHQQLATVQRFARRYEKTYGQAQHVGIEYGDREQHANAFFPFPLGPTNVDLLESDLPYSLPQWIERVHALGGLVSLNHPFLKRKVVCGDWLADADCVVEVARQLLDNRALGADLLEVGYLDRGLDLRHHLQLWDTLTANWLYLHGTGVTDSHGGEWEAQKNCMTTWVLAPSTAPSDLLSSLRSGQMFFGNPLLWQGVFGFRVGQAFMGERLPNPGGTQEVTFELDPWPEDLLVFLVQGLIQPGLEVEYLHRRTQLARGATVTEIDASRPSFVRLEAWSFEDPTAPAPIAFTNTVVLLP